MRAMDLTGLNRRLFTMIELMIVIGVIMILTSLLLPALSRAKDVAKSINCCGNLRQLAAVFHLYLGDSNGMMIPVIDTLAAGYRPYWPCRLDRNGYLANHSILQCPAMPLVTKNDLCGYYGSMSQYGLNSSLSNLNASDSNGTSVNVSWIKNPSGLVTAMDSRKCDGSGAPSPVATGFFRIPFWSGIHILKDPNWGYPDARHRKNVNVLWFDGHSTPQSCPLNPYDVFPFKDERNFDYRKQ